MGKPTYQSNPKLKQIFNDLELYREFCVDYGYKYDEATLYDMRNYVFRQFNKVMSGKPVRNNWSDDIR